MLPEFQSQLFQLPLIATTWTSARNRYIQEKENCLFPIRFILSIIEQSILLIHGNIVRPLVNPCHRYCKYFSRNKYYLFSMFYLLVNSLDGFLCSHMDSFRYICPIVDQTSDEVIERYGDLFFLSFLNKTSNSSSINSNIRKGRKFLFMERYFQFLTNILIIIETYSKYIQNELNDHIDTSRNLWKNLNMEDGRSLDEVEVRIIHSLVNFIR
jgi:hypothetical protein